jgi:battenin
MFNLGSFGYASLTSFGLTPKEAILIMLVIPVIMTLTYIVLPTIEYAQTRAARDIEYQQQATAASSASLKDVEIIADSTASLISNAVQSSSVVENVNPSLGGKLRSLLQYMIPLFLVYFAEYFINQGLFELLYFKDSFIKDHSLQYRFVMSK